MVRLDLPSGNTAPAAPKYQFHPNDYDHLLSTVPRSERSSVTTITSTRILHPWDLEPFPGVRDIEAPVEIMSKQDLLTLYRYPIRKINLTMKEELGKEIYPNIFVWLATLPADRDVIVDMHAFRYFIVIPGPSSYVILKGDMIDLHLSFLITYKNDGVKPKCKVSPDFLRELRSIMRTVNHVEVSCRHTKKVEEVLFEGPLTTMSCAFRAPWFRNSQLRALTIDNNTHKTLKAVIPSKGEGLDGYGLLYESKKGPNSFPAVTSFGYSFDPEYLPTAIKRFPNVKKFYIATLIPPREQLEMALKYWQRGHDHQEAVHFLRTILRDYEGKVLEAQNYHTSVQEAYPDLILMPAPWEIVMYPYTLGPSRFYKRHKPGELVDDEMMLDDVGHKDDVGE